MTRPLRLEYPGALYHVTSRGDRRKDVFLDELDRVSWIDIMGEVCKRFNWVVHAYCQMTNHYHVMVETVEGNLSAGMRQLNGVYTQRFNRRHDFVGHLFQGRYKAILVQKEAHLLELARYIVLNPVRAGMVRSADDWKWSSFSSYFCQDPAHQWLDKDWLLSQFGSERTAALTAFQRFVIKGVGLESPLLATRHQLLLGDDGFVGRHRSESNCEKLRNVSIAQRRALALTLPEYKEQYQSRNEAIVHAFQSGAFTMAQIAQYFGVHTATVRRALRAKDDSSTGDS